VYFDPKFSDSPPKNSSPKSPKKPTLRITRGPRNGILTAFCPKHDVLNNWMRNYPGFLWDPDTKSRTIPLEFKEVLIEHARKFGFDVVDESPAEFVPPTEPTVDLFPWQREAFAKARRDGVLLTQFDTGCGKSISALALAKSMEGVAITVAPKSVCSVWPGEYEKFFQHADTDVQVLWSGKDEPRGGASLYVVSYHMLAKFLPKLKEIPQVQTLIFDELDSVKNGRTGIGEACVSLSLAFPYALKLGLTATPVANQVDDIWHQLHVLSPSRFSTYMKFVTTYCDYSEGTYGGIEIHGVNPQREEELKWRISAQSIRKTKAEVAHLLPPVSTAVLWSQAENLGAEVSLKGISEVTPSLLASHGYLLKNAKVGLTIERIQDLLSGVPFDQAFKICVLTHLRETAEEIASALKEIYPHDRDNILCVTGEIPAKKRMELVKSLAREHRGILVGTLHSIGVGVDLTAFGERVIFAELYWSPRKMIQALGRFVRLNRRDVNVMIEFLGLRGTVDELIAMVLEKKISEALKIGGVGADGEKLSETLSGDGGDEESFLEEMREQLSYTRRASEDEYNLGF
jgi:SNF2 family DNA or RNA helicase